MILNKINTELLNSLHENINDPFLVLDTNGNIVLFNKQASDVLGLKGQQNIYDVLDKDSSEKFHQIFQNVINNNELEKSQVFLKLNSGRELNGRITLNSFRQEDESLLFCTIKIQSYNISTGSVTNFQVKTNVNEIINNPKVISLIDEIKSSYPFTLTRKERIRKLINEIDELFWVKNTEGIYVIANNKVAETIGINLNQIEGKNENSFIPTYLINFHLLLDQYVRESLNCIVVEGVRLNGFSNSQRYQTVEIPLLDSDQNLAAIICVGQKIEDSEKIILQQDLAVEDKELILKGELFEKLFLKNPLPIFIVDKENLEFIDANEPAIILYGYTKDEFLNKDLTDLYSQEDIQTLLDSSVENLKEGIFYGPYNHKKKNGSLILVEIAKISIKFNGRDANLTIITDVTEKNQIAKNNQIYKASFENTSDLLFITDSSGFITFLNSAAENKLGYSLNDIENTSFTALLQDDERAQINNEIFKQKSIDTLSFELELKKSAGDFIKTNLKAVPLLDYKNEIDSFVITAEIIKPEKIEEKPVSESSYLNSNQIPLSNVFHEILTPINVILGFVQELTENQKELSNDQKEAVDIINHNRVTLLNTMNSIIEYSKLEGENSELKIEEIKITNVIDKLHKEFNELKGTRKVDFAYGKISSSLTFKSDKQKFQYLISLLLMMGIQMSKEEKIYLSAYQINDSNFAIIIKDNYNFTSQDLLKDLNSISDADDLAKGKNSGISKYTSKLIKKLLNILHCEKQIIDTGKPENKELAFIFPIDLNNYTGGNQNIEKEPEILGEEKNDKNENQFTQLYQSADKNDKINLSQEKINSEVQTNAKTDSDILLEEVEVKEGLDLSKLNCLYIEDQIDSQILFKVQMKDLRKVKFALNFENAIPMLEREQFDFIVIDINLPGDYNGLDALKIIHQSPGFENIPIIAVSAYLSASEKEKFIAAGFSDFISKPLFKDKLYESLNKIF